VLVKFAWEAFLACAGNGRNVFCRGWVWVVHTSGLFCFLSVPFCFFGDYIMCGFSCDLKRCGFFGTHDR